MASFQLFDFFSITRDLYESDSAARKRKCFLFMKLVIMQNLAADISPENYAQYLL